MEDLRNIGQNFDFICVHYWVNFDRCKWPNFDKLIWPSGHTGYEFAVFCLKNVNPGRKRWAAAVRDDGHDDTGFPIIR